MDVKTISMNDLKEAVKALNDTGEVDPKIKVVGTKKEIIVEQFTKALEALNEAGTELPTVSIEFYNALYEGEEETEPKETEEEEQNRMEDERQEDPVDEDEKEKETKPKKKTKANKEKKKADKKAPAKKETRSDPVQRKDTKKDDYGFTVGSQNNLFCKAIKKKMMSMADIKEIDWNEKSRTFYDTFNRLVEKGLATKDEKTGKMKMIKK
ncbi:MAG: hypothetical protein E3J43_04215 [Candidatus Heimdallarchaeota archaeon]|nr:MAG: hypothetical protein E3J43_04215 [Candidatus Heimdallarchaeota archaeon]